MAAAVGDCIQVCREASKHCTVFCPVFCAFFFLYEETLLLILPPKSIKHQPMTLAVAQKCELKGKGASVMRIYEEYE